MQFTMTFSQSSASKPKPPKDTGVHGRTARGPPKDPGTVDTGVKGNKRNGSPDKDNGGTGRR